MRFPKGAPYQSKHLCLLRKCEPYHNLQLKSCTWQVYSAVWRES